MTKIVFACKSNSCRSQMAEGWAKDWIRREEEDLRRKLSSFRDAVEEDEEDGGGAHDESKDADDAPSLGKVRAGRGRGISLSPGSSAAAAPSKSDGCAERAYSDYDYDCDYDRAELMRRSDALKQIVIMSVALDSSAVFKDAAAAAAAMKDDHPCFCCGDLCDGSSPSSSLKNRKAVKEKAVSAMAEDGIDISEYAPKTIEEIMPHLLGLGVRGVGVGDSSVPASVDNDRGGIFERGEGRRTMGVDGVVVGGGVDASVVVETAEATTIVDVTATTIVPQMGNDKDGNNKDGQPSSPATAHHNAAAADDTIDDRTKKPVDKLIVLCSCGDDVKKKLTMRSRSVEEWNIDAPTAAAKGGEGDGAYRRVSHEIRREVGSLLGRLIRTQQLGGDDGVMDVGGTRLVSSLRWDEEKKL